MNTAEQALKWLDPSYSGTHITDQGITTLAAVKNYDANKLVKEQVLRAVKLIADDRNSEYLRMFAATGEVPAMSTEDAVNEALAYFSITDRTQELDRATLDALLVAFENGPEARRHHDVLLEHYHPVAAEAATDAYEHPVGLGNLGNTCYLNSLLQYCFAIKPFREVVRNWENYKQDLQNPTELGRVVGAADLTIQEVEKAQECMFTFHAHVILVLTAFRVLPELAFLFDEMATTPQSSVKPKWRLAELALKEIDTVPSSTARRNTLVLDSPATPSALAKVSLFGPVKEIVDQDMGDASSDVTLIGDTVLTPDSEVDENQKESAVNDHAPNDGKADSVDVQKSEDTQKSEDSQRDDNKPSPPSREPPPIPPRRAKDESDSLSQVKKETENAAMQQDVHEVMNKVLYQTQCAMRPESIDRMGNQVNSIRR
jgi:ubiquitin carboxyl-terminal hydrolase 25/28